MIARAAHWRKARHEPRARGRGRLVAGCALPLWVTHAFDQSQRLVPLGFAPVTGGLSITLPTSGATAPPGPYMLFLVNGNGVPSVGRIMLLH